MLSVLSRDFSARFAFKKCEHSGERSPPHHRCFQKHLRGLFRRDSATPTPKATAISPLRGQLRYEDVLLESVDFHCSPNMAFDVVRAAGGFGAVAVALKREMSPEEVLDRVRSAIWLFRSSTNTKKIARVVRSPSGSSFEFAQNREDDDNDDDPEEKRSLRPLWELIRGHADVYSRRVVRGSMRGGDGRCASGRSLVP